VLGVLYIIPLLITNTVQSLDQIYPDPKGGGDHTEKVEYVIRSAYLTSPDRGQYHGRALSLNGFSELCSY